jgi:PTH1 family peptidyl-tRNA hydrolase
LEPASTSLQLDLIVGLGNIGERYAGTRHNVGFEVLDLVAQEIAIGPRRIDDLYFWCSAEYSRHLLTLAWPKTFMNRSGQAAIDLIERYETTADRMLVIVDDFNLPIGSVRFRQRGSDGGHNGLASLIDDLGTEDFPRLRVGIGEPTADEDVVDFVLGRYNKTEREAIESIISFAAEGAVFAIDHHFDEVMSRYNRNPA